MGRKVTRNLAKLNAYRATLINRRKKYREQHMAVGGIDRELVFVTARIIRAEMRELKRKVA